SVRSTWTRPFESVTTRCAPSHPFVMDRATSRPAAGRPAVSRSSNRRGSDGCAPAAACCPTPSTNPLATPDSGARGGAAVASLAPGAVARRAHPSISRSTAGSAPRATKSARSLLVGVKLRQLRWTSAASSSGASVFGSHSRARSAKVRTTCVNESPARSSLVRAGGEGGGGGGDGGGGGSWDGAAGRVTAVAPGLRDGATGVGFAAGRAATGARRRRLATRPATLPPRAETLAPILDPTAVMLDHLGSGSSGWNHQYAPAATPPNKSTSRGPIT